MLALDHLTVLQDYLLRIACSSTDSTQIWDEVYKSSMVSESNSYGSTPHGHARVLPVLHLIGSMQPSRKLPDSAGPSKSSSALSIYIRLRTHVPRILKAKSGYCLNRTKASIATVNVRALDPILCGNVASSYLPSLLAPTRKPNAALRLSGNPSRSLGCL